MTVELDNCMASDLDVVNAAKVSFHKRSDTLGPPEVAIIGSMLRNGHGSPFEHCVFRFRVRVPIGVAREWFRHRIGSFNEESTRYVKMRPDFYVPEGEAVRGQVGKAMAYSFEPLASDDATWASQVMVDAYEAAFRGYEQLIGMGVAKELARNVLPLGLLTEFVWTVNLRALFNFLLLRNAPPALLEIRQEAAEVERLVAEIMPATMRLWNEAGRPKV